MSGMFELQQELNDQLEACYGLVGDIEREGVAAAEARGEYRAALRARILQLRAEGRYPATLVPKIAEGANDVNAKAVEMECAEARYQAAREALNVRKRALDITREQMQREWTTPGRDAL